MSKRIRIEEHTTRRFDVLGTIWEITETTQGWEIPGNRNGHPDTWEEGDGETETFYSGLIIERDKYRADYAAQLELAYKAIKAESIPEGTGILAFSILAACEALWESHGSLGIVAMEEKKK